MMKRKRTSEGEVLNALRVAHPEKVDGLGENVETTSGDDQVEVQVEEEVVFSLLDEETVVVGAKDGHIGAHLSENGFLRERVDQAHIS